jgi:2'-phosphotransferase
MTRNHIHFATSLPSSSSSSSSSSEAVDGMEDEVPILPTNDSHHCHHHTKVTPVIKSGIRTKSEIYIYINGTKCALDNVPFYQSDNGVILTAGMNEGGVLPMKYFAKVVDAQSGRILWEEKE